MAVNINNWKNTDTSRLQSTKLRKEGSRSAERNIRLATKNQVKARVNQAKARVQLSVKGQKIVAARTPLQHGQVVRRSQNPALRHSATTQAGKNTLIKQNQSFLKARADAAKLIQKLSGNSNATLKSAVHSKGKAADVGTHDKGYTLSQTINGVPQRAKGVGKNAPKTTSAKGKARPGNKKGKVKADPKLAKQENTNAKKGTQKAKSSDAKHVSTAGNAAVASKGHTRVKDGSKIDRKDVKEKDKEKKSSRSSNKAGAAVRDLKNLTAGIQTNVGAGSDSDNGEWQTDSTNNAIAKSDLSTNKRSLMEENLSAVTYNEPSPHDGVWNLHKTYTSEVLQPRLEKIQELHESVTGRLVALRDRLISDPDADPELINLLKKNINNRSNVYGGTSA